MRRLEGKVALVTAAAQGIGKATAERFAREGARVIATDINTELLGGLAGCETRRLDVTSDDAVKAIAAEIGDIDILFNCAGFVHSGTILDCEPDAWAFSFDLNVTAMYRTIRAFLPGMLKKGGLDRQHGLGRIERERRAESVRLWCLQGRSDRPDEVGRGGFRGARYPLQRDLSRHD